MSKSLDKSHLQVKYQTQQSLLVNLKREYIQDLVV